MGFKIKTQAWLVAGLVLFFPFAIYAQDPAQVEFFEKKIRPVLSEHCAKCHDLDGKKPKGGFSTKDRPSLLKGGDSGPALVPGKPAESLLIQALGFQGDLKMPPKGKLPDSVIEDFTTWVKKGAVDPRDGKAPSPLATKAKSGNWWSFKTLQNAAVPEIKKQPGVVNDIDRFIQARLQKENLPSAPEASKTILARRIYFDLTGLAPTPQQLRVFLDDSSPNAYEKLVDSLLQSPHFGERWGRNWLDVVRFSESSGGGRTAIFPDAWRFRDYVIRSFNQDKPFNRFIQEQIAGDLLEAKTPAEVENNLVATTFLAIGPTNFERQDKKILEMDVIDEQLDTLGKAFLGMTLGCARCHDHKFDPIPTQDYYALAGIFKSTKTLIHDNVSKWVDRDLPVDPASAGKIAEHKKLTSALENQIKELKSQNKGAKPILAKEDLSALGGLILDDSQAEKVGDWKDSRFSGSFIGAGYIHDDNKGQGEKTVTFNPEFTKGGKYEVLLAYAPGGGRADSVPVTIFHADGETVVPVNMKKSPEVEGRFVSLGQFRFEASGQGFIMVSNQDAKGHVTVDAAWFLPLDEQGKVIRPAVKNGGKPGEMQNLKKLEDELKALKSKAPPKPVAMSVEEEKTPANIRIFIRGNIHTPGALVTRGYLSAVSTSVIHPIPAKASGRNEFALWLTDPGNTLTSRVTVNRLWHWLFGSGLVRTTDNFGITGETPSHPELLDFLATRFVREGWTVKKLVKEMALSGTYRQSSETTEEARRRDPDNRLLSHMNRRRLEAEQVRDTMLQTTGNLDLAVGGPNIRAGTNSEYGYKFNDFRRSVYTPVFRNTLPELFEVFDFPDPNLVIGKRNTSTVAPQALFLMNNPQVMEYSRLAAAKLLAKPGLSDAMRVQEVFLTVLNRQPEAKELDQTLAFSRGFSAKDKETAWAQVFQATFSTLDFRYLH
ncbi:MAG: DUF1553 domain-containing protein [Gemmataceae bacterium]|nr:DUF1553 domain-containing protein [Gemmataceae bacterium]